MIHKDILDKNEVCYALLSSYNEPNILIPIRGLIKDIKFDYEEPNYLIRIDKFYDNLTFIKKYVFDMFFYTKFDLKHKTTLSFQGVNDHIDLSKHLEENDLTVVNHSLMTFSSKARMFEVFDKLQFYFISLNFLNLKENITRSSYRGFLKFNSQKEFFEKLESFIGDKFPTKDGIEMKDFVRDIERTKPITALKYEKIKTKNYIRKK
jgi:hypothetical protein